MLGSPVLGIPTLVIIGIGIGNPVLYHKTRGNPTILDRTGLRFTREERSRTHLDDWNQNRMPWLVLSPVVIIQVTQIVLEPHKLSHTTNVKENTSEPRIVPRTV